MLDMMVSAPQPTPSPTVDGSQDYASVLPITQATAATFSDLFIRQTFFCFVLVGTKRVTCPINGEVIAGAGDLIIFPAGSVVTLENRPLPHANYRADGVHFAPEMVKAVFSDSGQPPERLGIQIVRADPHRPIELLRQIQDTLANTTLPLAIRQHRLLEPLIWLRHHGVQVSFGDSQAPLTRLRALIETDLERPWRAPEVAKHFAMSEATFRRWLAKSGHTFAKVLHNTRLESGLFLLQNTKAPVAQVALECGFKTPSHFSDAFKKRFGITPMAIRSPGE